MNYTEKLNQAKSSYPFARWRRAFEHGLLVYTQENCDAMQKIFDDLIDALIARGENANDHSAFFNNIEKRGWKFAKQNAP